MSAPLATRLKVGVIGLGKMGRFHLEKYLALQNVELVGVYDADANRTGLTSAHYGVPSYDNLPELLFDCDAVSIASSTASHYTIARQALEAGVHILLEKPMTETIEEAEELLSLAAVHGLCLQVGFLERYRFHKLGGVDLLGTAPAFIEARRFQVSPGREVFIDVVEDLMIHDLDLVLFLAGEMPENIRAKGYRVATTEIDTASVRLEFPSGLVANLTASRVAARPLRKFFMLAPPVQVSMDFLYNSVHSFRRSSGVEVDSQISEAPQCDPLHESCESFVRCALSGLRPQVDAHAGLRTIQVVKQIQGEIKRAHYAKTVGYSPEKQA